MIFDTGRGLRWTPHWSPTPSFGLTPASIVSPRTPALTKHTLSVPLLALLLNLGPIPSPHYLCSGIKNKIP